MTSPASSSPDKPAQIGKYTVVDRLGRGAMGAVYRCHDSMLNRQVAVKLIASSLDQKDMLRARFVREAQSAAQLNHPNIVTVYEFGEHDGEFFMAMELLEGNDLKDVIAARTQLTLDDKLNMMEQICDGLGFAHKQGVIHRDLKPGNMHVLPDGRIKVLDFGLARIQDSDVTKSGMVMGTPSYMSPEQVRGEVVGTRSEVFSIGIVFYELLTYSKPFEAESMHAVMFKVVQCERKPISELARSSTQARGARREVPRSRSRPALRRRRSRPRWARRASRSSCLPRPGSEPGPSPRGPRDSETGDQAGCRRDLRSPNGSDRPDQAERRAAADVRRCEPDDDRCGGGWIGWPAEPRVVVYERRGALVERC